MNAKAARIGVINRIFQETAKYRKSIVIADVDSN